VGETHTINQLNVQRVVRTGLRTKGRNGSLLCPKQGPVEELLVDDWGIKHHPEAEIFLPFKSLDIQMKIIICPVIGTGVSF